MSHFIILKLNKNNKSNNQIEIPKIAEPIQLEKPSDLQESK